MARPTKPGPMHREGHLLDRSGWLRAAVLGANDGILSTASLIVGVAAAGTPAAQIALTGVAGLVAGAMSMAAGEYVSVSSQADVEAAELARETVELATDARAELRELAGIYEARGLDAALATEVATQLTARDALAAHARDELGLSVAMEARPVQAAMASAASFSAGAAVPLLAAILAPRAGLEWIVTGASVLGLAALGVTGARLADAPALRPTLRVVFWGIVAMAGTALIGKLFGTVV